MRLHLHIRDGDQFIEDPEGSEFETLDAARDEALHSARDPLAERLKTGRVVDGQKFEICNEAGALLATVAFKAALRLR